jgi:peptide/nickel transport system ATP-binding protein
VGLKPPEAFLNRYPHELSGGQRQRVAVARAIILNPDLVIADEPVSMMDASIRAGVMNMMLRLRDELTLTYLFITHDLAVARYMADRIAIMYLGELVEVGPTETLIDRPAHPYTRILLSAVPVPDPLYGRGRVTVPGEIPNPSAKPPGCRFHPRCSYMEDICRRETPRGVIVAEGHSARCHFALDIYQADGS